MTTSLQPNGPVSPHHVAIIMDGNGRWAQTRGLPRTMGHRAGVDAVRRTVEAAGHAGVRYLTLFGFSTENWRRPQREVRDLLGLIRIYLRAELGTLIDNRIRLRIIGNRDRLPASLVRDFDLAERRTADLDAMTLTVAIDYGGRDEIVRAVKAIAAAARSGAVEPEAITEATIAGHLFAPDIPDVDLLIRTSGEARLSNFLLWRLAYAELVFVDTLWPDFGAESLDQAIDAYHARDRRFGAIPVGAAIG